MTVVVPIPGGSLLEVGSASRTLKEHLRRIGVEAGILRRVMIAAYEAEANVAIHATRGTLFARLSDTRIDLEVVDEGPGIADVELALTAGYSTASEEARKVGFGAGLGLPNIRKSSDRFEIDTVPGRGTTVRSTILLAPEAAAAERPGCAPELRPQRCTRCLACVRACPVEALRLGSQGPLVLEHLCVGCAVCMEVCPAGVFGIRGAEAVEVAPDSVLVGPRALLAGAGTAVREAGFPHTRVLDDWEDAVVESACAPGAQSGPQPRIPPACPAIVHLVETAFPSLIPNLVPRLAPVEAAAEGLGLAPVVVVAGCPAQAAALDGSPIAARVRMCTSRDLAVHVRQGGRGVTHRAGAPDVSPTARVTRSSPPPRRAGVLRVEGIHRVQRLLSLAERGLLPDVQVLDARACVGGCAGAPGARGGLASGGWDDPALGLYRGAGLTRTVPVDSAATAYPARLPFAPRRGVRLDPDMVLAMAKLRRIDELTRTLPGRDCTVCGSPTCATHAEDVVLGRPVPECPYMETAPRDPAGGAT